MIWLLRARYIDFRVRTIDHYIIYQLLIKLRLPPCNAIKNVWPRKLRRSRMAERRRYGLPYCMDLENELEKVSRCILSHSHCYSTIRTRCAFDTQFPLPPHYPTIRYFLAAVPRAPHPALPWATTPRSGRQGGTKTTSCPTSSHRASYESYGGA